MSASPKAPDLEVLISALTKRVAELEDHIARPDLRRALVAPSRPLLRSKEDAFDLGKEGPHTLNRRRLLTGGAAVAVGGVGAILATSEPAAAANGDLLTLGNDVTDTTTNATTLVTQINGTVTKTAVLNAINSDTSGSGIYGQVGGGSGSPLSASLIGNTNVSGLDGVAGGSVSGSGVYGISTSGSGVYGVSSSGNGVKAASTSAAAVYGLFGNPSGAGPYGIASAAVVGDATNDFGVLGLSANKAGVVGLSSGNYGVIASGGPNSPDLVAGDPTTTVGGRLLCTPWGTIGPPDPTVIFFELGEQVRDSYGQMYIFAGTLAGNAWQKVAAVAPGASGGSMNMLPTPFRLYDSRAGQTSTINTPKQQLQPGSSHALSLAAAGNGGIPTGHYGNSDGAVGIIGTITITNTSGAGYIALYPTGGSVPPTSNINWTATGQTVAASYVCGLSPNGLPNPGSMTILNGGSGPTDVILDIAGFVY